VRTDGPACKVPLVTENNRGREPKHPKPKEESLPVVTTSSMASSIPDNQSQCIFLREGNKDPAEKDMIVLNALPACNVSYELKDEVVEGPHSGVFDEAWNRMRCILKRH
jgi:hypothetical protein